MSEWKQTNDGKHWTAPEGVKLFTKIDDDKGSRNETTLVRKGGLWWVPDGSMYVYYVPTHYREGCE